MRGKQFKHGLAKQADPKLNICLKWRDTFHNIKGLFNLKSILPLPRYPLFPGTYEFQAYVMSCGVVCTMYALLSADLRIIPINVPKNAKGCSANLELGLSFLKSWLSLCTLTGTYTAIRLGSEFWKRNVIALEIEKKSGYRKQTLRIYWALHARTHFVLGKGLKL